MATDPRTGPGDLTRFLDTVESRLRAGKGLRRNIPGGGRLQIDRPLPLLAVQRVREGQSEADETLWRAISNLLVLPAAIPAGPIVGAIGKVLGELFGAALVLEVWAGPEPEPNTPLRFRAVVPGPLVATSSTHRLQNELAALRSVGDAEVEIEVARGAACAPPDLEPLLTDSEAETIGCTLVGLEVPPVYRDPETGQPYPTVLRDLRREMTPALRRWAHDWAAHHTTLRPVSYQAIGPRRIPRSVWEVDRRLAEVADAFDFLLQVTPVNSSEAWTEFKQGHFQAAPALQYRPLRVEPTLLKRQLFAVPIERIDDPALYQLFREKQDELDRQIAMLLDMNTPRFVHGSIQLYGAVSSELLELSRGLLRAIPTDSDDKASDPPVGAQAFARRATEEIEFFRSQWPGVDTTVEVRQDIYRGLVVSKGSLMVGHETSIPAARVEALIQHEIGTHVLTYYNGKAQPFRQLYSGLAGYDPLQEGIAVLAEAFAGGLSGPRRRLLVGRVLAAHHMLDGASFVETFRELHDTWGFGQKTAFTITLRIYRGGGLTKDAVYVRGVGELLEYLAGGGELESLLLGKIAAAHVPLVEELRSREVLVPPPLRPRYLDTPATTELLAKIRAGRTLFQMLEAEAKDAPAASLG